MTDDERAEAEALVNEMQETAVPLPNGKERWSLGDPERNAHADRLFRRVLLADAPELLPPPTWRETLRESAATIERMARD